MLKGRHALLAVLSIAVLVAGLTAACGNAPSRTGRSIALSNSYIGNSWRQTMVKTFQSAASTAASQHLVPQSTVVNGDNTASTQIAEVQSMIVQGWKAIAIDAASPTALNGVIQRACDQGIKVIVFDSLATAPCAYKVAYNYVAAGEMEADFVANELHGTGNVLEIRGVAGTSVDHDIHEGLLKGFHSHPGIHIVGSVYGQWTETVAQQAVASVLPSLPKVDAVVDQGGDGAGAALAFEAAHRPVPSIMMGNRGDELKLWAQLDRSGTYHTFSLSSAPGVGSIAFWVAYELLRGEKLPHTLTVPLLVVRTPQQLQAWLRATPTQGVATPVYTLSYTRSLIRANERHTTLPQTPLPGAPGYVAVPGQ